MTTTDDMGKALQVDPLDGLSWLALADMIEETGKTARNMFDHWSLIDATDARIIGEVLSHTLNANLADRIEQALGGANASLRLLEELHVHRMIINMLRGEEERRFEFCGRSGTPKVRSSSIHLSRTITALVLVCLREDGKVIVDGGQASPRDPLLVNPGDVWPELAPWDQSQQSFQQRLARWARSKERP